ncbi:MAG: PBP1A family penicillin-binding protein [Nitrospirae bacterium]|nr:PBP1A family penicillin-binding protein [Nitrospirota bacterium]
MHRKTLQNILRDLSHGISRLWSYRWRILVGAVPVLTILFALYLAVLYGIVTHRFEGQRWRLPSKVYSDSFILYPGLDLKGIALLERLRRLDYHPTPDLPDHSGEYHLEPDSLTLYLHDFDYPDHAFKGFLVRLTLDNDRLVAIQEFPSGERLALAELEPELIAAFFDQAWEERDLVRLNEVPDHLIDAILAAEDSRFYRHGGIDLRSMVRAILVDLKQGAIVQGGSTLTQQLVKNFYLNQERTLTRKVNEIFMALLLDLRYSKDEILEAYLNEIYFAQSGTMGIYGVGQASRFYFGKRPHELTRGESALLAGMIKSPNLFSPFRDPLRATARKAAVLDRMRALAMIEPAEYEQALREPIPNHPPIRQERVAPYFVDFVRQQLAEHYSPDVLTSEGLKIFTTLDLQQQRLAEEALAHGLRRLERENPQLRRRNPMKPIQACLIALQPQTGQIKAMVGGRNYAASQFNRATQARRQPGSLFKPFVYLAALTRGLTAEGSPYTPATLIEDSPISLVSGEEVWTPQNYDKTYYGVVTLRTAIENSLNAATVRLADAIGIENVSATAQAMGINSPLKNVPSLALGTSEVIPLEMAIGYATIANGGIRVEPLAVKEVVSTDGRVLERRTLEMTTVLTPPQAYLMTHLLEGVVEHGTGRGVRSRGFMRPVTGKTGTTSDYKDAWFAGFTPDLLGLVWVGFDEGEPSQPTPESSDASADPGPRLTGAQAALPIWTDFMKGATAGYPITRFAPPSGIVFESIDPKTGLVTSRSCSEGIEEAFLEGTEPTQHCGDSDGLPKKIYRWFKQLISSR